MTSPPMLIPVKLSAPPSSFFHFLLGYFLPVAHWLHTNHETHIRVQDTGPLTAWFDLLGSIVEVDHSAATMDYHTVVHPESRDRIIRIRGWDARQAYQVDKIQSATKFVFSLVKADPPGCNPPITVIKRGSPHSWYSTQGFTSASERRTVPNIDEIARCLEKVGEVNLVDSAQCNPREQVEMFSRTSVLVAQHGAALANMVWMPPGGTVVEIFPPAKRIRGYPPTLFADLAQCLGHAYVLVPQTGIHDPVDPELVSAALRQAPLPHQERGPAEISRMFRGHALRSLLGSRRALERLTRISPPIARRASDRN